ncbi:GAF domain-containing sensor histidine kinase [Chloroflexia bacterium SDU3-3]|nr:GAF domain-containing sensor histidine kinase [Chloroflexia bacterium SDU3-3]
MAATDNSVQPQAAGSRKVVFGGEAFYLAVRWVVVLVLVLISGLITGDQLLSPAWMRQPVVLIIGFHALFSLLETLALFVKPLTSINRLAFYVDVIIITLLAYFGQSGGDLFYPLYFLPLVGAGMQMNARRSLLLGCLAAGGYVAAVLALRMQIELGPTSNLLAIVALAMRCTALIIVPWLTGGLADRSGQLNRHSVVQARQETQRATHEALAYREQTKALFEVAYTLSTTMNYQSVMDVMLLECRKLVPYTSALTLLSTGMPDELYVAASVGLSENDKQLRPITTDGPVGNTMRTGEPVIVGAPAQHPELQIFEALRTCRSACVVPMRAGLKSYGMFVIAASDDNAFDANQLSMVTALTNYAIIALHNAQLVHDLREERNKLISKEEDVRHQLARDLHDGPAQALAAITMNLEFIKRLLERDPSRVEPELDKLAALAKRTTHDVRTLLFELRPLVLEKQGLDNTLRQYVERFQGNATQVILEADKITADLDSKAESTLFNIVQESVNNALKHAKAKHIWVRLKQSNNRLEATVQDDGLGFELKKVLASYEQRGSFGLLNIEERAKLIGGAAELYSAPGEGTTVKIIVPLT